MTPGVHYGVPIDIYHGSIDSISKTGLDAIERSPAIYYALTLDPERPYPKERVGQLEGSLAHCAVLEPDQFKQRYAIGHKMHRATKEWKAFAEQAYAARLTAIQVDQYDIAMRQAEAVHKRPEIRDALAKGKAEVSAFTTDEATQEQVRCRPDFVHEPNDNAVVLLDLKTFSSADPQEFARQAARKNYAAQSYCYSKWYAQASGKEVLAFLFVVVTTEHPFLASACMLDEPSMASGERYCRRNLDLYSQCKKSGVWPAWEGVQIISLPQWSLSKDTE